MKEKIIHLKLFLEILTKIGKNENLVEIDKIEEKIFILNRPKIEYIEHDRMDAYFDLMNEED